LIVFRYLSKQILQVMAAVSLILLIVALTSRFIQYLGDAVAGKLASDVLLLLLLYRLPEFLLVILPMAFFLGILLAYGRMYADNEMIILTTSGFSQRKLLLFTLGTSSGVILIIALISLLLAPWGLQHKEQLRLSQQQLTEVDLIIAGQFQTFSGGDRVTYAERIGDSGGQGRQLQNVFVALSDSARGDGSAAPRVILAESAHPVVDEASGARFMRLENVMQYDGIPGEANFSVGQVAVQAILLPDPAAIDQDLEEATMPTRALLGSSVPAQQAELQWRLSILILIPVITFIAVPLSKVEPRHGRYGKLVPATLIYAAYYVLLQYSKDLVADGSLSASIGLWWVHLVFIGFGLVNVFGPAVRRRLLPGFSS
jgi:lipopolysaccharide export system permease protein